MKKEEFLNQMKETLGDKHVHISDEEDVKQELPKWFNGELYEDGATVTNRFGGDSCYLNAVELSMYDFVIGASNMAEMGMFNTSKHVQDLRKGLNWFRKNNPEAYMVLLD